MCMVAGSNPNYYNIYFAHAYSTFKLHTYYTTPWLQPTRVTLSLWRLKQSKQLRSRCSAKSRPKTAAVRAKNSTTTTSLRPTPSGLLAMFMRSSTIA